MTDQAVFNASGILFVDQDPESTTSSRSIDSDGDGLPDGWIDGWINKNQLSEILTLKHQSLFHELAKEKAHKNQYRIRMFEAVALGSVCFNQIDQ